MPILETLLSLLKRGKNKPNKGTFAKYIPLKAEKYTEETRQILAKNGYALPDGSFPIATKADLASAINDYKQSKNKARVKQHIMKRAREMALVELLPKNWRI